MASSLESELKTWEEKASKRKQQNFALPSATKLREHGNEFFRAGDFAAAEKLYTECLSLEETVEALANRALARLKLNRSTEALEDCNKVIRLDPKNVKGWARRATAKSNLGDHQGALLDFIEAENLEPGNKVLRREREREEAFVQAAAAVGADVGSPNFPGLEEEDERPPVVEAKSTFGFTPSGTEGVPQASTRGLNDDIVDQAIETTETEVTLPQAAPQSAYVFSKTWRDLQRRPDLRRRLLLQIMSESDFERCFSKSLEVEQLMEMISVLNDSDLLHVLCILCKLKSFSLLRLMLDGDKKAAILSRSSSPDIAPRIRAILG